MLVTKGIIETVGDTPKLAVRFLIGSTFFFVLGGGGGWRWVIGLAFGYVFSPASALD